MQNRVRLDGLAEASAGIVELVLQVEIPSEVDKRAGAGPGSDGLAERDDGSKHVRLFEFLLNCVDPRIRQVIAPVHFREHGWPTPPKRNWGCEDWGRGEREEERDAHTPRIGFRGSHSHNPIWLWGSLLFWEVHAPHKVVEAGVGADGIPLGLYGKKD